MTINLELYDPNAIYADQKKFDCGLKVINAFVHNSLKKQVAGGFSVAHVLVDDTASNRFAGFFTTAQHSIDMSLLAPLHLGSLPKKIPCTRLVMLGVDSNYQGKKLGLQLMREVFAITKQVATLTGSYGLYLDADPGAIGFYQSLGFVLLEGDKSPTPSPMFLRAASIA
jgi:GNAT superfamily N-acetyltransferase